MKRLELIAAFLLVSAGSVLAAPLATAGRTIIPKETQQIICVDYRNLKSSPTAVALKDRVLPPNMKEYENALKGLGLDPDKDLDLLTFVSFRSEKGGLRLIGIAQGQFPQKQVLARFKAKKIKGTKYHTTLIYPQDNGMSMSFLDDNTMLFGDDAAIKAALDARDGYTETLASNPELTDLINSADTGPVWSVLDQLGTQNMMRSALGDASTMAGYDTLKKRLVGSRYAMDFVSGVTFDLNVVTSDAITAGGLAALVKTGLMIKRATATGVDKLALDNLTVDSDAAQLRIHFKTKDNDFQTLLHSDLFTAVATH
ncbi:MAG: hypothetical protein ABSD20_09895 [Terriglobales bacterium]|jgi:hypothetical protein